MLSRRAENVVGRLTKPVTRAETLGSEADPSDAGGYGSLAALER
jgi:hypothetical protein